MEKVIEFLNGFDHGSRAKWCRANDLNEVVISQIANRHKGIGLEIAQKIIDGSGGKLTFEDFRQPRLVHSRRAA